MKKILIFLLFLFIPLISISQDHQIDKKQLKTYYKDLNTFNKFANNYIGMTFIVKTFKEPDKDFIVTVEKFEELTFYFKDENDKEYITSSLIFKKAIDNGYHFLYVKERKLLTLIK